MKRDVFAIGESWDADIQDMGGTRASATGQREAQEWPEKRYFGQGAGEWANWIAPWIPEGAKIGLELGCGDGRILQAAVAAGYRMVGVDSSLKMLAACKSNMPKAAKIEYVHAEVPVELRSAKFPRPQFAYMINVLNHLPRRIAYAYLAAFREILPPGGRLILDWGRLDSDTYRADFLDYCERIATGSLLEGPPERDLSPGREYYLTGEILTVCGWLGWQIVNLDETTARSRAVLENPGP